MNATTDLSADEVQQLRGILAEKANYSGSDLAHILRVEQRQAADIEAAKRTYWSLILNGAKTDVASFKSMLAQLGRKVPQFESDARAVEMDRRATAKMVEDARVRDEILERARPFHLALEARAAEVFGDQWKADLASGVLQTPPFLIDYQSALVTTVLVPLKAAAAALQDALFGIDLVYRYIPVGAPTYLQDARKAFEIQVATHLAKSV